MIRRIIRPTPPPPSEAAPTISFPGLISDCQCKFDSAEFSTELATPTYGWSYPDDEEAAEAPFPAQVLAAYQIFIQFFIATAKKVWVHLGAEMQAGKTGAVATLIRLILSNFRKLNIHPDHIFVITGMSDTAWKKQTKRRLIHDVRNGVEHNNGLDRIAREIRKIYNRYGTLKNILVIIDESHIASMANNRPNSIVFNTIKELCPRENWCENNIRFLTISATDPAKVLDITASADNDCAVVRLQTTPEYQSVETLNAAKRIVAIQSDIHSDWAIENIRKIITEKYNNEPLYHILRPKAVNYQRAIAALRTNFPDAEIKCWDAATNSSKEKESSSVASSVLEDDINILLEEPPAKTTFIILKNMFYAAKTVEDEHVGIMFDRVGAKDDTNLQSLLGRACGYGKSKRTIIFTSQQTVNNYITLWKELCSKKGFPQQARDIPVTVINKKMPRVVAYSGAGGTNLKTSGRSTITGPQTTEEPSSTRAVANEDNFSSEWREFKTFAEAKVWATRVREKEKNEQGFYLSSTTSSTTVLSYDTIMGIKAGKKTANMPWGKLEVRKHVDRLYVGYKDITDPTSGVFIVHRLTRIQ